MAKTPKPAAKKPRAAKAVSAKSTTKAVKKTDTPKKDRRGTPKGKATGVGRGQGGGGKIGNPPFVATDEQREQVIQLVAGGAPHWLIAKKLDISRHTLERHFRHELDNGLDEALGIIGGSMIGKALAGDHDAQKYVLARRGDWKTRTAVEQSGPNGGPIVYVNEPPRRDLSHLTEAELLEYERLTEKLEAAGVPSDQ